MLVVADTSPLIVLVNLKLEEVLPKLFAQVVVPEAVFKELRQPNRPLAVRRFAESPPAWLISRAPFNVELIPELHAGETAAISLCIELNADLLLIDEIRGRRAAAERKIRITRTVGVLELAAREGLVSLPDVFERIKRSDFWISHKLLDVTLERFLTDRGR